MMNLIRADLFKLRKSVTMKVLAGITLVCALSMTAIVYSISGGQLDNNMNGIAFMFSDINVMSILGAVLAGVLICGDFDTRIIQDSITSGCSRGRIILAKGVVLGCALTVLLFPYALVTGIALKTGSDFTTSSNFLGFLHLLATGEGTTLTVGRMLLVMLTLILVYVAQLSLTLPLAFLLRKPIYVVALYYSFSLLVGQLAGLAGSDGWISAILSATPYDVTYLMMNGDTPLSELVRAIAVSVVLLVVMAAVTFGLFRKKDIK